MTEYENVLGGIIIGVIATLIFWCINIVVTAEPKTFEDAYNKAYEQCLTEQQNNTKITNKEYYCVNYATTKVR